MNLTPTQLSLVRLLGRKELTFGCLVNATNAGIKRVIYALPSGGVMREGEGVVTWKDEIIEILGHIPTIADLHRWMVTRIPITFRQSESYIEVSLTRRSAYDEEYRTEYVVIRYESSKDLLDQSEETLKQIESLILSNQ